MRIKTGYLFSIDYLDRDHYKNVYVLAHVDDGKKVCLLGLEKGVNRFINPISVGDVHNISVAEMHILTNGHNYIYVGEMPTIIVPEEE